MVNLTSMDDSNALMEQRKLALAERLLISPQKARRQFVVAAGSTLFAWICFVALWRATSAAVFITRPAGIYLTLLALVTAAFATLLSYVRYLDWRRAVSSKRDA